MKALSFKHLYSRFLAANPGELHFAAHSHHFWPDVTREAHLLAWDDAARFNDRKWEHLFNSIIPRLQKRMAGLLNLSHPEQIALAPNTHDLLLRVFSAIKIDSPLRLLTTDSEFHSFGRQLKRWEETGEVQATRLKGDGLLDDRTQWLTQAREQISSGKYDAVFLSQVFFNSGLALSSTELVELFSNAPTSTVLIVDGYHAFTAIPTDLKKLEGRIFYLGGGYKYAQGGEGVGFLVVPKGPWRPVITGWFAEFAQLSAIAPGAVPYSQDGMAFWGATQDPTGWYRFLAVWDQWERLGQSVSVLHETVKLLQLHFLEGLAKGPHLLQDMRPLFEGGLKCHGHFLTWEADSEAKATALKNELLQRQIYIDQRGKRLRFGFGVYQDLSDVAELLKKILN